MGFTERNSNFLKELVIRKIIKLIKDKQASVEFRGHFYMDHNPPLPLYSREIFKVNISFAWRNTIVNPISWYSLRGDELLEIYSKLVDNSFYFYKRVGGKEYKFRLKNGK